MYPWFTAWRLFIGPPLQLLHNRALFCTHEYFSYERINNVPSRAQKHWGVIVIRLVFVNKGGIAKNSRAARNTTPVLDTISKSKTIIVYSVNSQRLWNGPLRAFEQISNVSPGGHRGRMCQWMWPNTLVRRVSGPATYWTSASGECTFPVVTLHRRAGFIWRVSWWWPPPRCLPVTRVCLHPSAALAPILVLGYLLERATRAYPIIISRFVGTDRFLKEKKKQL